MSKQIKILIGVFVAVAILVGAFFLYNKLLISEKPTAPKETTPQKPKEPISSTEKISPKLSFSIPQKLEVPAYKTSSFNFSIENEKGYPEAKDVNIALSLEETPISVTPNNISIAPGESQTFKVKLDKLEPGNYNLYLKIQSKPDISINKTIPLKSQIVVGLGYYHSNLLQIWKREAAKQEKKYYEIIEDYEMVKFLDRNDIKSEITDSPLSSEFLGKINVMIVLSQDLSPFSFNEKQELKNFLDNGGGLLLVAPDYKEIGLANLNDLIEFLHLNVKINRRHEGWYAPGYFGMKEKPEEWTNKITKHPLTSGIEQILYGGYYTLDIKPPMIPLVRLNGGETIYAVQYYAKGKIGVIGSESVLKYGDSCYQCQKLYLNLIKWLAAPEICEEMG